MNNKMTSTKNVMIILLAALVVVSAGAVSYGSSLKAEEAAPEEYIEEAVTAAIYQAVEVQEIEVPAEEPAPAEEPEQPAEEPEQPAEEPEQPAEETEEAFDVEKAYEEYCKLGSDAEKEEYLNALSAENRELLLKYIEEKEAAAAAEEAAPVEEEPAEEAEETDEEEPEEEAEEVEDAEDKALDINIWYEFDGDFNYGTKVIWKSSVDGLKDGQAAKYQWQVDKGNGWEDIDGANADTYEMIVDTENAGYTWRLVVDAE